MNASEDFTLTREVRLGLYVFLCSERERHKLDVLKIESMLKLVAKDINMTRIEIERCKILSERYEQFDL